MVALSKSQKPMDRAHGEGERSALSGGIQVGEEDGGGSWRGRAGPGKVSSQPSICKNLFNRP